MAAGLTVSAVAAAVMLPCFASRSKLRIALNSIPTSVLSGFEKKVHHRGSMRNEPEISRRNFAGAATLGGITFLAQPQRVFGANDRVRVAICGIRGRGMDHVK